MIGPRPDAAPTIVMLHEGLGSVTTWGEFPAKARRGYRRGVFVYSRAGYGKSSTMHAAAPARLHAARGDGRAAAAARRDRIPARHPARPQRRRDRSPRTTRAASGSSRAGRRADGAAFLHGSEATSTEIRNTIATLTRPPTCARRLARHHADVDRGVSRLERRVARSEIRDFDLTDALAYIRVPVLVMQGARRSATARSRRCAPSRRNAIARSRRWFCRRRPRAASREAG